MIERLEVSLKGVGNFEGFVRQIDYNARGQRLSIAYGNGAHTTSDYDPLTFRLTLLKTGETATVHFCRTCPMSTIRSGTSLDPGRRAAGDLFQKPGRSGNGDYVYDAVYRLIGATGREHAGGPGRPKRISMIPGGCACRCRAMVMRYTAIGSVIVMTLSATSWD